MVVATIDQAALHHERDMFELAHIGERVARYGDDVGQAAGLHRPDIGTVAKQLGGVGNAVVKAVISALKRR